MKLAELDAGDWKETGTEKETGLNEKSLFSSKSTKHISRLLDETRDIDSVIV
jgi:hypothetical protein